LAECQPKPVRRSFPVRDPQVDVAMVVMTLGICKSFNYRSEKIKSVNVLDFAPLFHRFKI